MNSSAWDRRIARAEELAEDFPFAGEVLGFYLVIARFQKALYGYVRQVREKVPPEHSFSDSLDLTFLLSRFSGFLNTVRDTAPDALAEGAKELSGQSESQWEQLLDDFWQRSEPENLPYPHAFFARAFLQPYAEFVAQRMPLPNLQSDSAVCPLCYSEPVVGVLREEQLGARRSLICSLCGNEWNFPRVRCAGCGEDRNDALGVFTAETFDHVRIEACDTCKCYIKTVDLTRNGLAVPVVDELATVPLTLWAQEHGYKKLQPNLLVL